jgi:hypothetical protein
VGVHCVCNRKQQTSRSARQGAEERKGKVAHCFTQGGALSSSLSVVADNGLGDRV